MSGSTSVPDKCTIYVTCTSSLSSSEICSLYLKKKNKWFGGSVHILELCFLNHKYGLDKNNLFIEGSPVFLRPSVEVASETVPLVPLSWSLRKSSKIIAVLLPNSKDAMRIFARAHWVKSHHDLTKLSLGSVLCSAVSVLSFSHLFCLTAGHFGVEYDVSDHVFIYRYLFAIFHFSLVLFSASDHRCLRLYSLFQKQRVVILSKYDKTTKPNWFPVYLHTKSN